MTRASAQSATRQPARFAALAGAALVLLGPAGCTKSAAPGHAASATLRIGVSGLPQVAPQAGLRQLVGNASVEGLISTYDNGRLRPWLADSWTTSTDGLSVVIALRPNAKFHDGAPVTAAVVAKVLKANLPPLLGPAFSDVREIVADDDWHVKIGLTQPSRFVIESLETAIQEPGKSGVGTGPFVSPAGASELIANGNYYLGKPNIDRVSWTLYPSVRSAWAELLRGNIDMLYEVDVDALDSLQSSNDVAVYSFIRHYQYVLTFNPRAQALARADVRRGLNALIDRDALIRIALGGHGVPSTGPVPPSHWALDPSAPRIHYDPQLGKPLAARHLKFSCLVPADSVYERIALDVKQQLAAAGVDMSIHEATQQETIDAIQKGNFEAVLVDPIGAPTLFRSYRQFYSAIPFASKPRGSAAIDAALETINHALTDEQYRAGVTAFQQAIVNDPPVLFLAWGERARAVSRKFDVVTEERGRDILINLRLWRPAGTQEIVRSRN